MRSRSPQMSPLVRRRDRGLLLAAGISLMLLALGASAQRAEAACAAPPPPEHGIWVNRDPNSNGITRVELSNCVARHLNCREGSCSSVSDSGWGMHVWGKCWPRDCDWGWSHDGFQESGTVYGEYELDFGKYRIKATAVAPNQLRVHWEAQFTDASGRADYSVDEWFVRPLLVSMVPSRPWSVLAPTG